MEPPIDLQENLRQLKQFQKKCFLEPSEERRKELQSKKQEELSIYQNEILISLHAVKDIIEAAEILDTMPPLSNVHRIGFIDLDQTLMFEGALGWIDCCFAQLPRNQWKSVFQLMLNYGFSSLAEFKQWGNTNFPTCSVKFDGNFYHQTSVIDPEFPKILENWHVQGMNIFGLTIREHADNGHTYTQQSLKEGGIDFKELSHIHLSNDEIKIRYSQCIDSCIDSGVIYSATFGKFGPFGAGIRFLAGYLDKLSKEQCPLPSLEVIVVDDCDLIFQQAAAPSNLESLQELEETFNTKIRVIYFQPDQNWLSPYTKWNDLKHYNPALEAHQITIQVLEEFLQTFRTPLKKPLPGPFFLGNKAFHLSGKKIIKRI